MIMYALRTMRFAISEVFIKKVIFVQFKPNFILDNIHMRARALK